MIRSVLISTALLCAACDSPPESPLPPDSPHALTLAWQANVNGDIEPCG